MNIVGISTIMNLSMLTQDCSLVFLIQVKEKSALIKMLMRSWQDLNLRSWI